MRMTLWMVPLLLAGSVEQEMDVSEVAGARLFADNYAACHGTDARGMGEVGQTLFTMPSDLTVLAANNGGMFPRDYVMGIIDGYHRDPRFSTAMPEFGAGGMGPTIIVERDGLGTPVPARLLALTTYLESVQE